MNNYYSKIAKYAKKLGKHPDFSEYIMFYNKKEKIGFVDLSFKDSEISNDYSEKYRELLNQKINPYYLARQKVRASSQYHFIIRYSNKIEFKNVLDIGASSGALLKEFEDIANLYGFEPDVSMFEYAKKSLPNAEIHNNIFDKKLLQENTKYDLITLSHVFEHLTNPIEKVKDYIELLNDNGVLFIEVPYDDMRLLKQIVNSSFKGLYHTYYYQPYSIKNVIKYAGGKIIAIKQFGYKHIEFNYKKNNDGFYQRISRRFKRAKRNNYHDTYYKKKKKGIWIRVLVMKGDDLDNI